MTEEQARTFALGWVHAWNSHDIGTIIGFYRPDIEYSSPFVRGRDDDPEGVLRGTSMLAEYFASAIERFPDLILELLDVVLKGPTLVLSYRTVSNLLAVETMSIDDDGRIRRTEVRYRPIALGAGAVCRPRSGAWPALPSTPKPHALTT